jgi:hypothetical protein
MSFLRRWNSSNFKVLWIPAFGPARHAFAGMTRFSTFYDFISIDENIFFSSFSELESPFFKIIYGFVIWNFGHWDLFVIRAAQALAPRVRFAIWNFH